MSSESVPSKGKKILSTVIKIAVIVVTVAILIYGTLISTKYGTRIDYREHLDEAAATVDGEDITLEDLAFYVMYEEGKVEKDATVYNPENTRDFWNVHTNGYFVSSQAKEAILGMAVHDRIFSRLASDEGMVLSEEEKERLEERRTDFWEDLYPTQREGLLSTPEKINHTMYEIALAEKYQLSLALDTENTYHSLDWNGKEFEKLRDGEHDVRTNDFLWDKVFFGDVTLYHGQANYLPAAD